MNHIDEDTIRDITLGLNEQFKSKPFRPECIEKMAILFYEMVEDRIKNKINWITITPRFGENVIYFEWTVDVKDGPIKKSSVELNIDRVLIL